MGVGSGQWAGSIGRMDHSVVVIGKIPPENTHTSFGHVVMQRLVAGKGPACDVGTAAA